MVNFLKNTLQCCVGKYFYQGIKLLHTLESESLGMSRDWWAAENCGHSRVFVDV